MAQARGNIPAAPFSHRLFGHRIGSPECFGHRDQPFSRRFIVITSWAVEDHILTRLAQNGVNRIINVELTGIYNCHVQTGGDGMIEEDRMHRAAHWFIATEAEREVRKPARKMDMRAARLDLAHAFDKIDRIIIMLFNPRRDGKYVGIKNDVFRREADGEE